MSKDTNTIAQKQASKADITLSKQTEPVSSLGDSTGSKESKKRFARIATTTVCSVDELIKCGAPALGPVVSYVTCWKADSALAKFEVS